MANIIDLNSNLVYTDYSNSSLLLHTTVSDTTHYTFTAPSDGFYYIQYLSTSSTAHDFVVLIGSITFAQYLSIEFRRENYVIPLKAGTVVTYYNTTAYSTEIYIYKIA